MRPHRSARRGSRRRAVGTRDERTRTSAADPSYGRFRSMRAKIQNSEDLTRGWTLIYEGRNPCATGEFPRKAQPERAQDGDTRCTPPRRDNVCKRFLARRKSAGQPLHLPSTHLSLSLSLSLSRSLSLSLSLSLSIFSPETKTGGFLYY